MINLTIVRSKHNNKKIYKMEINNKTKNLKKKSILNNHLRHHKNQLQIIIKMMELIHKLYKIYFQKKLLFFHSLVDDNEIEYI